MTQRDLPLIEVIAVLRDGTLIRDRTHRLSRVEEVRVYGRNNSEYVVRVVEIGNDGRTRIYRETGRRRPAFACAGDSGQPASAHRPDGGTEGAR